MTHPRIGRNPSHARWRVPLTKSLYFCFRLAFQLHCLLNRAPIPLKDTRSLRTCVLGRRLALPAGSSISMCTSAPRALEPLRRSGFSSAQAL